MHAYKPPYYYPPGRPSPMAVAIEQAFKPWKRHCRLRSFPHPDPILGLLIDTPHCRRRRPPCFHRSLSTPCFSSNLELQPQEDRIARVEIIGSNPAKGTQSLVVETAIALASGAFPIPASSGLGGAYFLRNRSTECFAVIKPIVNEHASGTGLREVAAYLLDHNGFSGVPPTALIKITHPALQAANATATVASAGSPASLLQRKIASIQRFVPHDFDAGDLGPSRFSVASVHRIGILDVRLLNIDRHAGNILVRKNVSNINGSSSSPTAKLVPIDHGLCLPELLDDPYFEWLHWPQATVPFSETETEYISALDPFKDAAMLRAELPSLREPATRILTLCTIFLKRTAAEGLCLADIGHMMTREFSGMGEGPSVLESLCKRAEGSICTRGSSFFVEDESSDVDRDCNDDDDGDDESIIQFEMDCEDAGFGRSCMGEILEIPVYVRSTSTGTGTGTADVESNSWKKQKVLGPVSEGEEYDDDDSLSDEEERDDPKLGIITKSLSLSAAAELNYESGGSSSGKCITLSSMSAEEWGLFLERFEQLLLEAIEERKSFGEQQKLGTS